MKQSWLRARSVEALSFLSASDGAVDGYCWWVLLRLGRRLGVGGPILEKQRDSML